MPTYSSLRADVQQNTSNIEDLPLNYDVVRFVSGSKIGVIDPYSSLAEDTSNMKELPQNYDIVRLENMSETKTGIIDQDSAEVIVEDTSNVKELPQNYDIVRLENMSESKTGVIDQDSAEFIRVQPAAVYSTVVRQNGKKMTVKLDAPSIY